MENLNFEIFDSNPEKETIDCTVTVKGIQYGFTVIKCLSFGEFISFVRDVVDNSFIDGRYEASVKKLSFNECLIRYYIVSHENLGAEQVNWITYNTNMIEEILLSVNSKQIDDLRKSIDEQITYRLNCEYNKSTIDELVKNGSEFIAELNDKIKDIDLADLIKEVVPEIPADELLKIIKELKPKSSDSKNRIKINK